MCLYCRNRKLFRENLALSNAFQGALETIAAAGTSEGLTLLINDERRTARVRQLILDASVPGANPPRR